MAGYIGTKAVITSGVSASIDELNLIDGVTATTAELNYNDTGAAVGVVVASRTVTADANKDVASFRNITLTGELDAGSLDISGNADIDGTLETDALSIAGVAVTTTAAELNLIDGGTARGTTAIVDADGVLINDAGTMRMTSAATLATYMGTKIGGGMEFLVSTGAISNAANVSITAFDNTKYDRYIIYFYNVTPATDNVYLKMLTSTDGGSNYDTTDGNYEASNQGDAADLRIFSAGIGSESNEFGVTGDVQILNPANANTWTHFNSDLTAFRQTGPANRSINNNTRTVTDDVDAVQILFTSGNIESGEITMFGIVNS